MSGGRFEPVDFDPFAEPATSPVPTTEAQREIWLAVQMAEEASPAYNQCFGLRVRGAFDAPGMRRALDALFCRHEALRLTFDPSGESQSIAAAGAGVARFVDLSPLGEAERESERARLLEREAAAPFDLARSPARALIVREAADRHTVLLCAHHVACDGWSAGVLLRDLGRLYEAEVHGVDARLPAPGRFTAFAAALDRDRARATEAVRYWQARFADAAPVLDLPLDRPRPAGRTFAAALRSRVLDAELRERLRALGAGEGCTLHGVLLAALQILLFRLAGQSDLVVGVPVALQAAAGERELVGHGTNLLPLRIAIDSGASFREQLRRTRSTLLDAHEHAGATFGSVLGGLRLPRDGGRVPLIAVTFNVDRVASPPRLPGATAEVVTVPKSALNFDAELNVVDDGRELRVEWTYDTALFDAGTIERWLGHYAELLGAAAGEPGRSIAELPMLCAADARALAARGAVRSRYPGDVPLHVSFARQAALRPDAVALRCEGRSLSYGELDRRADGVARALRERGVGRGARVGLLAERSFDLVTGILGILKAGAAYLPLDPAYPAERLRLLVADAAPSVVLAQRGLAAAVPGSVATVIVEEAAGTAGAAPSVRVEPADPAYVIYTSGSTGKPKGVVVTHHNMARLFEATDPWFHFGPGEVWTLFHSFAFDFSVWEMWGALAHGGRLVVVPGGISRDPRAFRRLLGEEGVTLLSQTPSAFRALAEADERAADAPPLSLRTVVFGGEALDLPGLRPWIARHGDHAPRLVNMYGITETTVHVTYREIRARDCEPGAGSWIGEPLPDLSLRVLDGHGRPVPIGVVGEIHVGGAGVSLGYWNRPELTAERFVPDPFSDEPGARLYRSGDLARYRADGELEYLGRIDHQVKIRGFRIELGEIEAVLGEDEEVAAAVVLARRESSGDTRLVAYVVTQGGRADVGERLRRSLRARLPEHMVPASIAFVAAIPLTENGKVDRAALLALEGERADVAAPFTPPRSAVEQGLAELWRALLGVDRVGLDDGFFDLGGDSLLAARMMARAETAFGVDLPLRRLFEARTLGDLARWIEAARWAAAPSTPARRPERDLEETEV